MQVFVSFDEVEREFSKLVDKTMQNILLTEAKNGERKQADVIFDYLNHKEWETRLKTIVGLSGGSVERLKRVCDAILPTGKREDIGRDAKVRRAVADFLSNPQNYSAVPPFIRSCFYLPTGWVQILRDEQQIKALALNSLQSKYAVQIGFAQEKRIVQVVSKLGLAYSKGRVEMVDNKEVDVVIPNANEPVVLIMSSYALTTSSSQSSRANEQAKMYENIQTHNRRRDANVKLLNVIDGGGWLARANDLNKILRYSDRNFSNYDLADGTFEQYLREIIR